MTAIDDGVFLDDADAEACEVVVPFGIHAGHLCRLAADECRARLHATLDDSFDDRFGDINAQFAGRIVVQEEQWLGTLDGNIVHAHRHQVDSDRVVAAGLDGQPQLRPDTVRSGNEHRSLVALDRQFEQRAEPAKPAENLRAHGALDRRLDALD